jgi:hypothetical protein
MHIFIKLDTLEFHDIECLKGIVKAYHDSGFQDIVGEVVTLNKNLILETLYCDYIGVYFAYDDLSYIAVKFWGYWVDKPIMEIELTEVRTKSDLTCNTQEDILDYFFPDRDSCMIEQESSRQSRRRRNAIWRRIKELSANAITIFNKTRNS